ncbi:MAG: hypothetical protein JO103_13020 [Candidatus Eremiobacteraeota bacterium]|nr:hypothetical protein [Candidatus Eremiobacteraeota bacterium]MBV9407636.1 hypothetical protein [Candidatus Eremiobacteraeota bacterium]
MIARCALLVALLCSVLTAPVTSIAANAHIVDDGFPQAQYLRAAPSLTLTRAGGSITGRLTDAHGAPLAHAQVALAALDTNARLPLTDRVVSGTVPAGAVSAVVGLRADTEGSCVCDGPATATVGTIHYRETTTGRKQDVRPGPQTDPDGGNIMMAAIHTLQLTPGHPYAPNLRQFPVTAGAPFTLDVAMRASANAATAGYATIVFLDASGKGTRISLWFTPSRRDLGTVVTDGAGRFSATLPGDVAYAGGEVRATYAGFTTTRSAEARLALAGTADDAPTTHTAPLVWLGARGDFKDALESDALWRSIDTQWSDAARHVGIVQFSTQFMKAVPDDLLAMIVRHLREKHLALGIESLAQNGFHEPVCGQGVEGYGGPDEPNLIVDKLLRAGGRLDYVGMDEPMTFGYYYDGPHACKSSIRNVAQRVSVIINIYRAAFPNVVVGDTEAFPAISNHPNWETDWAAWSVAFHEATGKPLAFLHLDFNWGDPRLHDRAAIVALARSTAAVARANGQDVGMIVNGTGGPNTDAGWMQQARDHADAIVASEINPDELAFTSWDKSPARMLPEHDPTALLSIIDYWFLHAPAKM